jgi:predicted PhzF superfamily epimerase YddE/YHI9
VPTLNILRVFVGDEEGSGNLLGVFLDGAQVPEDERQAIAHELGYSETVYVDDAERGELRIFTPDVELPFAGHPLVGTAWLLSEEGLPPEVLHPPAGEVPVRFEGDVTWIAGRPEWSPPMEYVEFNARAEIDGLAGPPEGLGECYCWAWEEEATGRVRARAFFPGFGIEEDEATGAAAIALAARLGRELEIRQGRGSLLHARPLEGGMAEVGGRTELDEVREYARA